MAKKIFAGESVSLEAAYPAARAAGWTSPVVEISSGPVFINGERARGDWAPWPSDIGRRVVYERILRVKFRADGFVRVYLRGDVLPDVPGKARVEWSVGSVQAHAWDFENEEWLDRGGPIPTKIVL